MADNALRLEEYRVQLGKAERIIIERNTRRESLVEERNRLRASLEEAGYELDNPDNTLDDQVGRSVESAEAMAKELLEAINAV